MLANLLSTAHWSAHKARLSVNASSVRFSSVKVGCNLYAEKAQMGRMDARRDTAVIPCGLKVDITWTADYGPARGTGKFKGTCPRNIGPNKGSPHHDASFSYASHNF